MRRKRVLARAVAVGATVLLVGTASGVPASAQEVNLCTGDLGVGQVDLVRYCHIVGQVDDLILTIDGLDETVETPDALEIAVDTVNPIIDPVIAAKCSPVVSGPYKSARYAVSVDAHAECSSEQRSVVVVVGVLVKKGGVWKPIGDSSGAGDVNADSTPEATATGPCKPDTNRKYRGLAVSSDEDGKKKTEFGPVSRVRCPTAVEILSDPIKIDPDVR